MNKILIDTNVILDLLAKREPFFNDCQQIFSLADIGEIELIVSTLSIVNTHYVLKDVLKNKDARSIIGKVKVLLSSYPLNDKIIELALNDLQFKDFEDGIQYYTALESKSQAIVTRNLRDFKKAALPVMSPNAILALLRKR